MNEFVILPPTHAPVTLAECGGLTVVVVGACASEDDRPASSESATKHVAELAPVLPNRLTV